MSKRTYSVLERRAKQREWIETHELRRDAGLDLLGVYGPVICPLIPGGLSAVSMINMFPALLHIPVWAAIVIALIAVAGVEILALLATETWLAMRRFNQTLGEGEEQAPTAYAGFVVFLYCGVVLSLVVFLKMWPGLAIYSLIPLTLMGLLTSWTVILRKQFNDLLFKRELAKAKNDQHQNLRQTLEDVERQLRNKNAKILKLQTEIAKLQTALDVQKTPMIEESFTQVLDQGRRQAHTTKRQQAKLRRLQVISRLQATASKDDINFEQWGRELQVSGQTIANDLRWLISQDYWENGDGWQITEVGKAYLERQQE